VPLTCLGRDYTQYGSRLGACVSQAVSVHGLACRGRVCAAGVDARDGAVLCLWLRDGGSGCGVVEMVVMAKAAVTKARAVGWRELGLVKGWLRRGGACYNGVEMRI